MKAIRRILVAIKNPDARSQPGVGKALRIAKACGASVELFHAAIEQDLPPHEAIVRRAIRKRADLIVAVCHKGPRLKPWLPRPTDRELLRASPIPVLLVKSARPWRKRPVLAAIDPSHAHAKPSRLDSRILAQGGLIAAALRAPLHLVHANFPMLFGLALGDPAIDAPLFAATYEQLQARARRDFAAFAERAHIPRARRHLVDALPARGISQVARQLGADLVVMGAVSRSGLKRIFIGNTAERVLKDLPCDVLVVKPARFQKRADRIA